MVEINKLLGEFKKEIEKYKDIKEVIIGSYGWRSFKVVYIEIKTNLNYLDFELDINMEKLKMELTIEKLTIKDFYRTKEEKELVYETDKFKDDLNYFKNIIRKEILSCKLEGDK